jgi:Mesyanzhinovviridae DNA polymerase
MVAHPHWLPRLIATANKYEAAGTKFLESHILEHIVNGRVHADIHPHRMEGGGARSLRFSYSNPPLQQMPSRDEELAPLIRNAFLPEEGEIWCEPDLAQQEFRFIAHHAFKRNLPGAREAVEAYRNDPDTDFHALTGEITGLSRADAKHVNFAKIYGAGVKKFAEMIGKPLGEAQAIYQQYDRRLPFVSSSRAPARTRRAGSVTRCSTTARAGTGIAGRRGPTARARDRARSRRRSDAASIPRTPGTTSGCSASTSTPCSTR